MCLIGACRSEDWEGYLAALENIIKYFIVHVLLNYARLMPVHLARINALENDHTVTWEALKSGDFVVVKSDVAFTNLFTDQTLEQKIKMLKCHNGIVGLIQDIYALDRLITTTPHLSRIIRQYLNSLKTHKLQHNMNGMSTTNLRAEFLPELRENAIKLHQSIKTHCKGTLSHFNSTEKSGILSPCPKKCK